MQILKSLWKWLSFPCFVYPPFSSDAKGHSYCWPGNELIWDWIFLKKLKELVWQLTIPEHWYRLLTQGETTDPLLTLSDNTFPNPIWKHMIVLLFWRLETQLICYFKSPCCWTTIAVPEESPGLDILKIGKRNCFL